ncbi:MAG: hypothetical protein ACO3BD_02430 [Chitinophagaceae bacterium]
MSFLVRIRYKYRQRAETSILLRSLQKFINQQECNFNHTEEMQNILWNYYRLKNNYRKHRYWKQDRMNISENEACFFKMMELYISIKDKIECPLNRSESRMMKRMIEQHLSNSIHIKNTNFSERRNIH